MKYSWEKSAFILIDIALACYLFLAITAFNKPDDQKAVCTQVDINIEDGKVEGFLGGTELKEQLKRAKVYPQGQPMKEIDVRKIEETILKNPFVETAECFKTQGGHIKINLTQRLPVVRVKAENGEDYYVDLSTDLDSVSFLKNDDGVSNYLASITTVDHLAYMRYDQSGGLRSSCEYKRAE